MIQTKANPRDPVPRARPRNASPDRVVELDGVRHLFAADAVALLTAGNLGPTQAAGRLRRLTSAGKVRARKLGAKLAAYNEADVLRALDELLDRAVRESR
jgi:hypothetical protein